MRYERNLEWKKFDEWGQCWIQSRERESRDVEEVVRGSVEWRWEQTNQCTEMKSSELENEIRKKERMENIISVRWVLNFQS